MMSDKKRARRKGAAMELALMVIVVSLSLSVLILTTSLIQYSRQLHFMDRVQQTVALEQISDEFCANQTKTDAELKNWFETKYPDYDFTVADGELVVCKAGADEALLTIRVEDGTITQWNKN